MIKYIYYRNENEKNQISTKLLELGISVFNIHKHEGKNLISFFYDEDYLKIDIGMNVKEVKRLK